MGTTSEKLTYLNGTKQLLKDKINNLGGSIDDNTTFRQYANQLQNVYDNLPKTEYQEGTEVNLGKTIKGKLDFDDGKVGFGQASQKTTQGYQLLNLYETRQEGQVISRQGLVWTINNDGSITITGKTTEAFVYLDIYSNENKRIGDINTTYTFVLKNTTDTNLQCQWYDRINGEWSNRTTSAICDVHTNDSNSTGSIIRILIVNVDTTINARIYPMIVKGSYNTSTAPNYEKYTGGQASPNPSYPQTINSVTGNQDVVVSGKNLVPFPYSSQAGLISGVNWSVNADGTINATGTANASSSIFYLASGDDDIYLDAGTYKISSNFSETDFSWQVIQIVNGGYGTVYWDNMVLTETTRLRIRVIAKPNATVNVQNAYLMIERGNQATTYEPYITPTSYQLSLGDIELNAIGNYKDELVYDVDEDKVYKNSKIWKKNITDSNAWEDYSAYWGACSFGITKTIFEKQPIAWSDMYSKYFKAYTTSQTKNLSNEIVIGSTTLIVNNKETSTLSAFRNWLASNPFYIYYQLATAVKEEITGTLKDQVKALYNAHSLNGTTIITSNGNLPMIIKCRALKGE